MYALRKVFNLPGALFGAAVLLLVGMQAAVVQAGMLGDVDLDGRTNILDIQRMVNQALAVAGETSEDDVNENGQVEILDIQNLVNTVLGEAGLLQRVKGSIQYQGMTTAQRVIAVSSNGLFAEGEVDPESHEFLLRLRVKTAWALALQVSTGPGEPQACIGTIEFPIADGSSATMPIPQLSLGNELDLGHLNFGDGSQHTVRTQAEIRAMIGEMGNPIHAGDDNGNGVPDFVEPLMNRVRQGPGVPAGADMDSLAALVSDCISSWLDELTTPDLTDANDDGVPDFVEPLIDCLLANIESWLESHGTAVPPGDADQNGTPDFVDGIINHVVVGIPEWLLGLARPEVVDDDEDGIPDFIEDHLSLPGLPSYVDSDGNGIPNFAEDDDDDGIPNIADPDAHGPGDQDGDGVGDGDDLDDDNDDVPDYADGA